MRLPDWPARQFSVLTPMLIYHAIYGMKVLYSIYLSHTLFEWNTSRCRFQVFYYGGRPNFLPQNMATDYNEPSDRDKSHVGCGRGPRIWVLQEYWILLQEWLLGSEVVGLVRCTRQGIYQPSHEPQTDVRSCQHICAQYANELIVNWLHSWRFH